MNSLQTGYMMSLNESTRYVHNTLHMDDVPVTDILDDTDVQTPVYVYSLRRALHNYQRLVRAFSIFENNVHVHYSAKANANLAVLHTLIEAGAGVDCVSAGEIYKTLQAGCHPQKIVFAGVGKTPEEIRYALQKGIGWFNVENVEELHYIRRIADETGCAIPKIALRLNPDVRASTHPNIATGHSGAKFGLSADVIREILANADAYLPISGIHLHIGSQLRTTEATVKAVQVALDIIAPYPEIQTVNIGGGIPVSYTDDATTTPDDFAQVLKPLLQDYNVILEPGRSVIADAGVLLTRLLYVKEQAGEHIYIVDASMTELMRPALYDAYHAIVPVQQSECTVSAQVVGPVCETTDVLAERRPMPDLQPGDALAILTTGAYGFVMANTYNQRPRPAEVAIASDGETWRIVRERETYADLVRGESL
jgi:diaminopimelate decarboxylase